MIRKYEAENGTKFYLKNGHVHIGEGIKIPFEEAELIFAHLKNDIFEFREKERRKLSLYSRFLAWLNSTYYTDRWKNLKFFRYYT